MSKRRDILNWVIHNFWVICISYIISMVALLFIHDAFGFSMSDDGTYLSNAVMHIGSGIVLGFFTGLAQFLLLRKHFRVSFFWVWALVTGFVAAETIAGFILCNLEIYRGLINIFNTSNHFPEACIFAFAGLVTGILQFRLLKPHFANRFYWIVASTLGWVLLILSTYLGLLYFVFGALLYGALTGLTLNFVLIPTNKTLESPSYEPKIHT